jgi:hypothetical protein
MQYARIRVPLEHGSLFNAIYQNSCATGTLRSTQNSFQNCCGNKAKYFIQNPTTLCFSLQNDVFINTQHSIFQDRTTLSLQHNLLSNIRLQCHTAILYSAHDAMTGVYDMSRHTRCCRWRLTSIHETCDTTCPQLTSYSNKTPWQQKKSLHIAGNFIFLDTRKTHLYGTYSLDICGSLYHSTIYGRVGGGRCQAQCD